MTVCHSSYDPTLPDTGGDCCEGAALDGPAYCTCWTTIYDQDQERPSLGPQQVRPAGMCGDCAYRPGSPEKSGDDTYSGDGGTLEYLAATGTPFTCHDGMRRVLKKVHPSGVEVPGHPGNYAPAGIGMVSARADGSPAYLCAGWDARRRAMAAER